MQAMVLAEAIIIFAAFVWAARHHFVSKTWAVGTRFVTTLSLIGLFGFVNLMTIGTSPPLALRPAALIFGASAALFFWAIKVSRGVALNRVFVPAAPDTILKTGPYAYVRHPFYTAYLLYWAGCALATWHPAMLCILVVLTVAYVLAARREEAGIMSSALSTDYAAYRRATGMFWIKPRRLWRRAVP
jgi:protein-S-isoprenylcysteine O-methyltransferase Ste14